MDRRDSTIRLTDDAVDQHGIALFAPEDDYEQSLDDVNADIAPWLLEPPTPPPKNTPPPQPRSAFPKPLASFAASVTRRGKQQQQDSPQDSKRRSADDGESARGVAWSSSSTYSAELRKAKSSLNVTSLFSKLRSKPSKTHLRSESDDSEHPSLRPPVPPLPDQRPTPTLNIPQTAPRRPKTRIPKRKTKASDMPPSPPPKENHSVFDGQEFTGELTLADMVGIVDLSRSSQPLVPHDPSSPSSGFHSSHSHSSHSSTHHPLVSPEFSDPFSSSPHRIPPRHSSKSLVSPHTRPNNQIASTSRLPSLTTDAPGWQAPESWAVAPSRDDLDLESQEPPDLCDDSDSDSSIANIPLGNLVKRRLPLPPSSDSYRSRHQHSNSTSTNSNSNTDSNSNSHGHTRGRNGSAGTRTKHPVAPSIKSRRIPQGTQPPPGFQYKIRIHRQNGSYHVVALTLSSSVGELTAKLAKKLELSDQEQKIQHNLYLVEPNRERMLLPHECPAEIVKMRMEQAGYDHEDSHHLLGLESLAMLVKFQWKSQLLSGEDEISLENFDYVSLSHRSLRTIPIILHQHAEAITALRLSHNPMSEIPLDFIQSAVNLRDIKLDNMSLRKVPVNLCKARTLHRIDLSSNCIKDLEDAYLDDVTGLLNLQLHNNRIEKLPWCFPRCKTLNTLNLANNRFRVFPIEITQISTLRDLDISFNAISELPDQIGQLHNLQTLLISVNRLTRFPPGFRNLRSLHLLDCSRNQIADLSIPCALENLSTFRADRNAVHTLDLSLGPRVMMLEASFNDVTQLSLSPGLYAHGPLALTTLNVSHAKLSSIDDGALKQLGSLRTLKLDHNSIRSLPDSLGELMWLETLSVSDNKLDALPSTIGNLQKLETLDAHNNSLLEIPREIWNCASLTRINVTSNCLRVWHDPPEYFGAEETGKVPERSGTAGSGSSGGLSAPTGLDPLSAGRKHSSASVITGGTRRIPPLVHALERLYLCENDLKDDGIHPLMMFKELRVLNLSFNEIQDLPPGFLRNMTQLEELYLSGNKLTSVPAEDFPRLTKLTTLFLNGNRLTTLPQEFGKLTNLMVMDVGSNQLRYNISNWEYEWNWNFNKKNLRYLNLSGNKRLQIKPDAPRSQHFPSDPSQPNQSRPLSLIPTRVLPTFTSLSELRVLGLMDVTIAPRKDDIPDLPDETLDRRIRTSYSTVCDMGYGIADSIGKNETLTMVDLVHDPRPGEAVFAMFGRTRPSKSFGVSVGTGPVGLGSGAGSFSAGGGGAGFAGASPNKFAKFLHDHFVPCFMHQLDCVVAKEDGVLVIPGGVNGSAAGGGSVATVGGGSAGSVRGSLGGSAYNASSLSVATGRNGSLTGTAGRNGSVNGLLTSNASLISVNGYGQQVYQPPQQALPPGPYSISPPTTTPLSGGGERKSGASMPPNPVSHKDPATRKRLITKALRWTFLKLNQDLYDSLRTGPRKNSQASMSGATNGVGGGGMGGGIGGPGPESTYSRTGVSALAIYFYEKTLYAANVGDCLAVVSRQGIAHPLSRKHDPYDPAELTRIRQAEGAIGLNGMVGDQVDVSRSFGYFNFMPAMNACPEIQIYDLGEMDDFVILANSGLWDFVPFQLAVDIARSITRTDRVDPMLAAQKLRDFAMSYGADGSTMIMVLWVADLFNSPTSMRSRQPTLDPIIDYKPRKRDEARDRTLIRLGEELPPPTGHLTIVFTDIRNSTHLWEVNPGMRTARDLHNLLLRRQLRFCGGYEVKTEGDAFMCSFPTTLSAVWWCLEVQKGLLSVDWPMEILECEDGQQHCDPETGQVIVCGLSVRMGIHCGTPICERDPVTNRMDYLGPMVNRASRISSVATGGQIMCSYDVIREINSKIFGTEDETEYGKHQPQNAIDGIKNLGVSVLNAGEFKLKGIEHSEYLWTIYPKGLEARHDLKEPTTQPTASTSRVQFSVPQMKELGLLCLRIEALSSGRSFKPIHPRKGSVQSTKNGSAAGTEAKADEDECSPVFVGDPELLLPPINDHSSDADLTLVLDSLSLRIDNAVNAICQKLVGSVFPHRECSGNGADDSDTRITTHIEEDYEEEEQYYDMDEDADNNGDGDDNADDDDDDDADARTVLLPGEKQTHVRTSMLMQALTQDGVLDDAMLGYLSSILDKL